MKILLFGLGSIGKRQAKLLQKHFDHELYAFRSSKNTSKNELGIAELHDFEEVAQLQPDIAFITNPTSEHVQTALRCAEMGMHIFMEKPLSNTRKHLDKLAAIVKEKQLTLYVAYCLRFHPVIKWLKEHLKEQPIHLSLSASSYLPNWRPGTDHKQCYSAQKKLGGGIILELSHEIDYLHYLFGPSTRVQATSFRAGDVTADANDFADILLGFEKFACNLHLNFFSRVEKRELILDFTEQTIIANITNNTIRIITDQGEELLQLEQEEMYLAQLHHFFDNLSNPALMNSLEEALPIFTQILDIVEAADA